MPEAEAGHEQSFHGAVDLRFCDCAGLHFVDERLVLGAARDIGPGLHGGHRRAADRRREMMAARMSPTAPQSLTT